MTGGDVALCALVAASGLHTGFQVTVTALVYPALARTKPHDWAPAHEAHIRSIVGIVAVVYATLFGATLWAVATNGDNILVWLAALGGALAVGITVFVAGPIHGRLSTLDPALIRALIRADCFRAVGAIFGFVAAILAAVVLL